MSGGDFVPESETNFTGFKKQFNTLTLRGRYNIAITTYGTILGSILLYKLLKKKPEKKMK